MTDVLQLTLMFVAGGVLAAIWMAGLWLDVRRLAGQPRPYTRLAVGALARLAVVAAGFYLIIVYGGHRASPLAALVGFVIVRYAVTAWVRRSDGGAAES